MSYLIKVDINNCILELLPGDYPVDGLGYILDEDEAKFDVLNTAPILEAWTYINGVLALDEAKYQTINAPALDAERIADIKQETRSRIVALIPGGTMENYLEKENYLHGQHSKYLARLTRGEALTATETEGMNALETIYDKMDDIIKMSNLAETNGDSIVTYQAELDAKGY